MWKPLLTATALAVATAVLMVASPASSQAAPTSSQAAPTSSQAAPTSLTAASGWRIDKVFAGSDILDLQAIAASGARNAWLLGLVPNPEPTFVTQRWNSSHWVPVPLPARLSNVIGPWDLFSGVYTTSAKDTWFFPDLPDQMNPVQYALRWNGSRWATSEVTASPDTVLDAAVFSSSDVWTFGEAGPSFPNYGPAVVRRWNGKRWRTVSVPVGTPFSVDGVAPNDIWALGVSEATVHAAVQAVVAMHWNGSNWSTPRLPAFRPAQKGYPWVATAISATGSRDAWLTETPAVNQQTGFSPPGLILLHWNGSKWRTVARSRKLDGVTGLTADGHGGFWLTGTSSANPNEGEMIDYRNGTFTSQPAPTEPGYFGSASGIVAVPGTGSFWATETLIPVKTGGDESAVLRYTPGALAVGRALGVGRVLGAGRALGVGRGVRAEEQAVGASVLGEQASSDLRMECLEALANHIGQACCQRPAARYARTVRSDAGDLRMTQQESTGRCRRPFRDCAGHRSPRRKRIAGQPPRPRVGAVGERLALVVQFLPSPGARLLLAPGDRHRGPRFQ
jgi:hypothetical protein